MRWFQSALTIGVGAVIGAITAVLAAGQAGPKPAASSPVQTGSPTAQPVVQAPEVTPASGADEARLAALEKSIAALQGSQPKPSTVAPPATVETKEQAFEKALAAHEERVVNHLTEPRDAAWAARIAPTVATALKRLEATVPNYSEIDCRRSTCTATLSWPSRAAATSSLMSILDGMAGTGCSSDIAFPPETAAATYRATLFLDCAPPSTGAPK